MYYLVHVQRWYEDNPVEGEPPESKKQGQYSLMLQKMMQK